jgi:hypothetical protein
MTVAYNSTDFWACKPSIHSYSTVYRLGEKTGGPRKDYVTNRISLSTLPTLL